MSDSSTDSNAADPAQGAAPVVTAAENRSGQEGAFAGAASQAAHLAVADLVARNEAYYRQEVEEASAALNARIEAEQARYAVVKSSILRANLLAERKAASSATFGLAIASILLVVGLIAGGVWYFSSQNNARDTAFSGVMPGALASTVSAKASDVAAPERMPAVINVDPSSVRNARSETSRPAQNDAPADTNNLSGAALGNSAGSDANTGPSTASPPGDTGKGTDAPQGGSL